MAASPRQQKRPAPGVSKASSVIRKACKHFIAVSHPSRSSPRKHLKINGVKESQAPIEFPSHATYAGSFQYVLSTPLRSSHRLKTWSTRAALIGLLGQSGDQGHRRAPGFRMCGLSRHRCKMALPDASRERSERSPKRATFHEFELKQVLIKNFLIGTEKIRSSRASRDTFNP